MPDQQTFAPEHGAGPTSEFASVPQVSVIIPVYDAEAYLPECLDSVLSQDFQDLQVVAVNDASPDRSREILRRYEQRDRRVTVVDLESNVGLGAARNKGLEAATGTYVLFLDADDALRSGALSALIERATAVQAEVVLFDWTRDYPDGRVIPGTGGKILTGAPDRFVAAEYPEILQLLQLACNKLVRRELLQRLGLRFADGYYEDTAFTYPLLLGAKSLTTVPLHLLRYRQRDGAITRTAGNRHVEVLEQWSRAMKQSWQLTSEADGLRSVLSVQMVKHCLLVLLEHRRIPKHLRRPYVRELRRLSREYRPAGGYPGGRQVDRVQQRLLELGSPALLRVQWALTRPAFLKGVRSGFLRKIEQLKGPRARREQATPEHGRKA